MTWFQRLAIASIRTKFKLLSAISKKKAAAAAFELFCTPQSRNSQQLPPVFKQGERHSFRFQQYKVNGYRWNPQGTRRALVLHGFESSVVNFDEYIRALINKGYEVLAFDAPAHGMSPGKKINALVYRDMIKQIHDMYGPVESFIAHSFGGLALSLALAEIKHDTQYRVAFVAPATETATAVSQFFDFVRITDPLVKAEFEEIVTNISGHPVAWFSMERALRGSQARIQWVHDEQDLVTPLADAVKAIAALENPNRAVQRYQWPYTAGLVEQRERFSLHFVITNGLGHRRIYRDPEVIALVTEFL